MKEKLIKDKDIIKALTKYHECTIQVICEECMHNMINLVLHTFNEAAFNIEEIHDQPGLYKLKIRVFLNAIF